MSDRGVRCVVPAGEGAEEPDAPANVATLSLPLLRPGTPVLVRPGNRVHVGSDPHGSLVIDVPSPVRAADVAVLLRGFAVVTPVAETQRRARAIGLTVTDLTDIVSHLTAAGLATIPASGPAATSLRIALHGEGPLADLLITSLTESGLAPRRSARRPPVVAVDGWTANLVVLTDYLVHDPEVVNALIDARIAHLPVRVRDGVGVVGPLVLPGLSSCLRCADRHRADLEPDWPMLAAQLVAQIGFGSAGIVRGTAALAQSQIEQLGTALWSDRTDRAPELIDRALEFHPAPARLVATRWPPHPLCLCRPAAARAG
ncbi:MULTISPECIES: hypothetical protein [Gordonia]|uniref:Cyclodehydratase n=1 Tax=Gordonia tangerina TaxID=2911060 RepID=A0ABS9DKU5_9ACTN|nr:MULTISPECIES: hypothetical protein [Gordonia]MCF3939860.1 hypothetical protein [Gordonia tangerina]